MTSNCKDEGGRQDCFRPVGPAELYFLNSKKVPAHVRARDGSRGGGLLGASWRGVDKIIEDLALHAFDLQPIAGAQGGPLIGPGGRPQLVEQALKLSQALPRCGEFLIVSYHGSRSTMPRFVPSRFICQVSKNSRIDSSDSMPSRSQKILAPWRACASACENRVRHSRGVSSIQKSDAINSATSTSCGSGAEVTKLPNTQNLLSLPVRTASSCKCRSRASA